MHRPLVVVTLLCACELCAQDARDPGSRALRAEVSEVESLCRLASSIQEMLQKAEPKRRSELARRRLRQFDKADWRTDDPGGVFLVYFRARLRILAGQTALGREDLLSSLGSTSVAPEALCALEEMSVAAENNETASRYYLLMGKILPVGFYGRAADFQASAGPGKGFFLRGQPVIPVLDGAKLARIADTYFAMRLFDAAADAYREAIYYGFAPARVVDKYAWQESWLSHEAAKLWLKAAQAELEAGNAEVAADYAAKAAVFATGIHKEKALALLSDWRKLTAKTRPAKRLGPKVDGTRLKTIAKLSVEMRMHPRALAIVKEYREVLGGDAKSLEAQYAKVWSALLEQYCAGESGKVILFGQDVLPKEKRLRTTIPFPCRQDALKEVVQAVMRSPGGKGTL